MNRAPSSTAKFIILLTLLIVIAGCSPNDRSQSPTEMVVSETTSNPEPTPSASQTSIPPTATETPQPPTQTLTATHTLTLTATPTSEPPSLVMDQDAACRFGPGSVYDIRAYLSQGDVPMLIGHTDDDTWWTVEEPVFAATCWVSSDKVTVSGDVGVLPIYTPEPTPTTVPTATPDLKGMKIYLVALGTGGPFGCGDGLVYFYSGKPRTGDIEKDTKSALHALFKMKTKFVGDYYNPIYNVHLVVKDVDVNHATGKVTVFLEGSIPKPTDACEAKRIHDQVWETARRISGFRNIGFRVGNKKLGDLIAVGDR